MPIPALQWGGLFAVIAALDAPLRARGYVQSVLIPDGAEVVRDRLRACGVEVACTDLPRLRRSPVKSLTALARMPGALRALRTHPAVCGADLFQAVGVHHPHAPWLSWVTGRPLIWQLHSDSVSGPFRHIARRFISRHHDGVIANGARIGRTFVGAGFGSGNHGVFFPPIAVDRFAPDPVARMATRAAMGIGPDQVLACTIGNRGWQKNHQLLIKAAQRCVAEAPNLRFVIAGADVAGYGDTYRREVLDPGAALNRDHPGRVRFMRAAPDDVADLLRAADIFVLSSHSEGIPLVVAEAMASATPVISTDVGSIAEILPKSTGRIVPPGDGDALARALCDLAGDAGMRDTMGAAALHHARATFCAQTAADTHAAIYDRALGRVPEQTQSQTPTQPASETRVSPSELTASHQTTSDPIRGDQTQAQQTRAQQTGEYQTGRDQTPDDQTGHHQMGRDPA